MHMSPLIIYTSDHHPQLASRPFFLPHLPLSFLLSALLNSYLFPSPLATLPQVTYKDPEARGLAEEQDGYDSDDYQAYEDRSERFLKISLIDILRFLYIFLNISYPRVKKRALRPGHIDANLNVLMPEDVTKAMLKKVCERFGDKTYNQTIGTSCHQCRQKTTDTKTICRSGKCVGVRGQFCGRCLEIRSASCSSPPFLSSLLLSSPPLPSSS